MHTYKIYDRKNFNLLAEGTLNEVNGQYVLSRVVPDSDSAVIFVDGKMMQMRPVKPEFVEEDQIEEPVHIQIKRGQQILENLRLVFKQDITVKEKETLEKYGVRPRRWLFRDDTFDQYSDIYEFIENSAEKHDLSPEFLFAVVMHEGLGPYLLNNVSMKNYNKDEIIDAYQVLGLDEIGQNLSTLIKEGYLNSIDYRKIDPYPIINEPRTLKMERQGIREDHNDSRFIEFARKHQTLTARVKGYDLGIELVAAELHRRRDIAMDYLSNEKVTFNENNSDVYDFATYAVYNGAEKDWQYTLKNIKSQMSKSGLKEQNDNTKIRYNALGILAISYFMKRLNIFRR